MRIKTALVAALAFRPTLLVLDEPFSGLDPLVREEFMQQMLLEAGGVTVLISSHELGEIEGVATHVGFIDEGKLLFQEPMQDLTDRFRQVRITLSGEAVLPSGIPADWLQLQAEGPVVDFVDTRYAEASLGERAHALFHDVRRIEAQPMTLRAIFTTLARAARDGGL
jgi:ABC-2 type transport system ATP-binding protein